MTAFRTCKNCVLEGLPCARREAVKSAIVGLGVTSIKMLCKERVALFKIGQRVSVTWVVPDDYDLREGCEESWPATVVSEVGSRFLIKVDDVDSDNETPARSYVKNASLYAKVAARKLKVLDEPIQIVCVVCGRVGAGEIGKDGCYAHTRGDGYPGYTPQRCAAESTGGPDGR